MKNMMKNLGLCVSCLVLGAAFAEAQGPKLVADYDRDGKIEVDDIERAAAGEAFTIWINDDDDDEGTDEGAKAGDTNVDLHDVPGGEGNDRDCEDDKVNGRCDLLDFFPVLADVSTVEKWSTHTWKLCGAGVNVVFTTLNADHAGDFHAQVVTTWDDTTPLCQAAVMALTKDGVGLPEGFLKDGKGVIVFEGAATEDVEIMLCGFNQNGACVCSNRLNLAVTNVEDMYGWMNLRGAHPSTSQPLNFSTSHLDNRHFVFVHGCNTNHEEARGNAAEFFKKLWQSGSDAMFTAVEWRGDQSQTKMFGTMLTPNCFANVANAFAAAKPFADACAKLPGEKILVGHSLGNVLISSAIKDYGLDYTKFVMLNAAVVREAFAAGGCFADLPRTANCYSPSDSFLAESKFDVESCEALELCSALCQEAGFWSLNAKIKKSTSAVDRVNVLITNQLDRTAADIITSEQLGYADVIESPAAGRISVPALENVNLESFIGENSDWPVYEGDETRTNEWRHSTFREVAFYHTSKFYASLAAVEKPRVIIDTDLGSSMDDLFAIDFAARMHHAGNLDLMAVMMNRPDRSDPAGEGRFLDFADRYLNTLGFGRGFPLGGSEALSDPESRPEVINPYWSLVHSNEVTSTWFKASGRDLDSVTNAAALYRRLLADAPDKSVVICSIGFFNNLRALMESGANHAGDGIASTGLELIAAKVKELRIMGGCFDGSVERDRNGKGEYNVEGDIPSAVKIFAEWPTPIIVTPWEVGMKLEYKPADVLADFPVGTLSPTIRAVYERWPNPPEGFVDRQWDPMAVFPLAEGDALVPLSEKGGIEVDENGVTAFTPDPSSNRCHQVASNMNETAVLNRFREICRTGNPSVTLLESGTPEPGVDYNGSELVFTFENIQLGSYAEEDLAFHFVVSGADYAPESSEWDETLGVLSVRFVIPPDAVTAGNVYDGTLTVTLENDELGSTLLMTEPRQLVQGVMDGDVVNANVARVDGGDEYATVAEAIAAANGRPIRLLHAASWSPTEADVGKPVRFLSKSLLVLDVSPDVNVVWSDADGNNATLMLGYRVTPENPVLCATEEEASNALACAVFEPSEEVAGALETGALREAYREMFTLGVVSAAGGLWVVEAKLTPEAWTNVVLSARQATRQIPVAEIAALAEDATMVVTVTGCEPGFYYTLCGGAALTGIVPDAANRDALCGADGTVAFPEVAKPSDAAGFFKIGVSATK